MNRIFEQLARKKKRPKKRVDYEEELRRALVKHAAPKQVAQKPAAPTQVGWFSRLFPKKKQIIHKGPDVQPLIQALYKFGFVENQLQRGSPDAAIKDLARSVVDLLDKVDAVGKKAWSLGFMRRDVFLSRLDALRRVERELQKLEDAEKKRSLGPSFGGAGRRPGTATRRSKPTAA